jgi:hypothetical protein
VTLVTEWTERGATITLIVDFAFGQIPFSNSIGDALNVTCTDNIIKDSTY